MRISFPDWTEQLASICSVRPHLENYIFCVQIGAYSKDSDRNSEEIPKHVIRGIAEEMRMFNWETRRHGDAKIMALKHWEDSQEKEN